MAKKADHNVHYGIKDWNYFSRDTHPIDELFIRR